MGSHVHRLPHHMWDLVSSPQYNGAAVSFLRTLLSEIYYIKVLLQSVASYCSGSLSHILSTVPELNQLSTMPWRRMGSGCIVPRTLDLVVSWGSLVSITPRGRSGTPVTHWIGGCIGPRTNLDDVERRRISGLNLRHFSHPARGQSLYRLLRPDSLQWYYNKQSLFDMVQYVTKRTPQVSGVLICYRAFCAKPVLPRYSPSQKTSVCTFYITAPPSNFFYK
jgi:hypothetical protein